MYAIHARAGACALLLSVFSLAACSGGSNGSPPDSTPDAFSFPAQSNVPLSAAVVSAPATISGINEPAPLSVSGGEYSIGCNGSFGSAAGTIADGQTVCLRHTSAAVPATATTTTLTVGGVSASFVSTTVPADTTPDAFSFTAASNAAPGTVQTSNAVTITGINTAAPVTVSGGEYSIGCNGSFTTAAGSIANGQTVCLRHTSASAFSSTVTTTLTVGGVSGSFSSTTTAADTTPDAFSFAPASDVPLNTVQTSAAVTINGIDAPTPVSVSGGQYSIGCNGSFTAAVGTIGNGQTVCLRHTSASTFSTTVTTTLTVGGVSGSFSSTTLAADTTPDAFSFTPASNVPLNTVQTSNTVTISGINTPAPVTVSGGQYSIGCNGSFTSANGSIGNGQSVCLRHTSASGFSGTVTTTLTVGGVSGSFSSTTLPADTTPDSFSFTSVSGVAFNTVQTSNAATITGIDSAAPVSVSGGQYSIGCNGSFTAATGTIANGQTVCLRHTSGNAAGAVVTTTLTIGGVQGSFSSTTNPDFLLPYVNASGELYGYLPRDRSSQLLDSGLGNADSFSAYAQTLQWAQIDPASGAVSGRYPESVVYAKNGLVYRARLAAGASNTPVQVSAINDACRVSTVLRDYAAPDNSWLVLARKGSSGDCTSIAPPTLVRATAAVTDSGVTLGRNDGGDTSLAAVHDGSGHIVSIVVSELTSTQMLRRYDANLQSPKDLMPVSSATQFIVQRELWTRSLYLTYGDTTPAFGVLRYDESTQSATVVHTFSGSYSNRLLLDSAAAYVADGNRMLRIPHTASSAADGMVLATLPNTDGSVFVIPLDLTQDGHLVLGSIDNGGGSDGGIWSVPTAGGSPLQLGDRHAAVNAVFGSIIFLNITDPSGSSFTASAVQPDGTVLNTTANAFWASVTQPQSYSAEPAGASPSPYFYDLQGTQQPTSLLRVQTTNCTLDLRAVDPLNPGSGTDLGCLGINQPLTSLAATHTGFGSQSLLAISHFTGGPSSTVQQDIYSLDLSGATPPKALNNTTGDNDAIFPY